ncbi:hypothetical protein AGLY_004248 [Aphis glycines]|uniref:Uncharacterized protein n=1 Tax=Aphis glycines TaxID=307491 RepID=A0A6G0TZV7_APHGL|nr:hypothetical protein AGLY_004248 [Aphis glycines]
MNNKYCRLTTFVFLQLTENILFTLKLVLNISLLSDSILNSLTDWKTVIGSLILSNNIRTQNIDPEIGRWCREIGGNKFQFSTLSSQNKSKSIASKTLYSDLTLLIITSKPIISLMTDLKSEPKMSPMPNFSPKFRPTFSHKPFEICKSNLNMFMSLPKYGDKTHIVLKSSNQIDSSSSIIDLTDVSLFFQKIIAGVFSRASAISSTLSFKVRTRVVTQSCKNGSIKSFFTDGIQMFSNSFSITPNDCLKERRTYEAVFENYPLLCQHIEDTFVWIQTELSAKCSLCRSHKFDIFEKCFDNETRLFI